MEEKKKKRKIWRWLIVATVSAVILAGGFRALHATGWMNKEMLAYPHVHQIFVSMQDRGEKELVGQREHSERFQPKSEGRRFHKEDIKREHGERRHQADGWIFFLITAGLVISGWFVRKHANESIWRKWTGWLLIFVGVLPILPLLVIGFVIYWLCIRIGTRKGSIVFVDVPLHFPYAGENNNSAILDKWEKQMSKEEK